GWSSEQSRPVLSAQLAHLVADEADDFQSGRLEQIADRFGVVLDERLVGKDVFAEPRFQLAFRDLLQNLRRLVVVFWVASDLGDGDLFLLGDAVGRHVLAASVLGRAAVTCIATSRSSWGSAVSLPSTCSNTPVPPSWWM